MIPPKTPAPGQALQSGGAHTRQAVQRAVAHQKRKP